tara:strand:- start:352 stop:1116 length:765 start_codon:yes stop_codon:yes gene_type:complete
MIFPLGALLKDEYTLPDNAEKGVVYKCPDCNRDVILRKGDVRKPHFAHKIDVIKGGCNFYNHPGESDLHKLVKHMVADMLKKRVINEIFWECHECKTMSNGPGYSQQIEYDIDDHVIVEYRGNGYVADVAVLNKGRVKYIFEICNTHKTTTPRPEPWFEIDAKTFLEDDDTTSLLCMRKHYCNPCGAIIKGEKWLDFIDILRLGDRCILCESKIENTRGVLYYKHHYRCVCRTCWVYNSNKIKDMILNPACMIE